MPFVNRDLILPFMRSWTYLTTLYRLHSPFYVLRTTYCASDVNASYIPESEDGVGGVGDSITYTFGIVNTGSVTLSSIDLLTPKVRN